MKSTSASPTREKQNQGERIAKAIARAGLCSRRDAERLILEGRIAVNGVILTTPATLVSPKDRITCDRKPLPSLEPTRVWRYHKPRGVLVTNADPQGRPTLFERLPEHLPRVLSIGRLDFNSEGLLLLTNDGGLARQLELPKTGWMRRYRVRVFGPLNPQALKDLEQGITIDGFRYGPIRVEIENRDSQNAWLNVGLREGKNREIRRVLGHLGLEVSRLIRLSFGPFELGLLRRGALEEISPKILREQLGRLL